ncbi:hypothetical protein HNR39_002594 [Glaciimonas immobilis]|uniref:Uncharacterized protein n=1 Tax=Glaciimonas immobilis TaxID=728004 RepID=A0A840RUB8_9BURK|nr:hypothetical protein [Glaciimonas immobilis]
MIGIPELVVSTGIIIFIIFAGMEIYTHTGANDKIEDEDE